MARGDPNAISLGPGYLHIGAVGSTEPSDLATGTGDDWTSIDAGWVFLGYTNDGSEFDYQLNTDPVEVAEELDPLAKTPTGRDASVTFALAQITASNLQVASNGGTITSGAGIVTFEPPDLGSEVRHAIGFQSEDGEERWVWRQCLMDGQMKIPRKKGADNATLDCTFTLEKPSDGSKLYMAIFTSPGRA